MISTTWYSFYYAVIHKPCDNLIFWKFLTHTLCTICINMAYVLMWTFGNSPVRSPPLIWVTPRIKIIPHTFVKWLLKILSTIFCGYFISKLLFCKLSIWKGRCTYVPCMYVIFLQVLIYTQSTNFQIALYAKILNSILALFIHIFVCIY